MALPSATQRSHLHSIKGRSLQRGFWPRSSRSPISEKSVAGEKKAYTALLQCTTFLCQKKWGPQRKDFGGRYGFPGFYRVFVSTTGLESFSLRPEKFSKRFSFGGGRVRFFLLCVGVHKVLVRKIWLYPPPPKRAQNEEKLYKSV